MSWSVQWAGHVDTLVKIYSKTGKMPKALENKPKPSPVAQLYIDNFLMLNDSRKSDDPIALFDIFSLADTINEDRLEFASIIQTGDKAYRKAKSEKQENSK